MNRAVDAKRIVALRIERGWSQEHLAEVAGVSLRTVQRAEGSRALSGENVQAIASAFTMGPEDILARPSAPAPGPKVVILPRIMSGKDLCDIAANAEMFQHDYDAPGDEAEAKVIGSFLQQVQDVGELWDDVGPASQVEAAHDLHLSLQEIERAGFHVFGARVKRSFVFPIDPSKPIPMSVATCLVLRQDNAKITAAGSDGERVAAVLAP
jgi:transcriptional regulator with XRE-family HTH domain